MTEAANPSTRELQKFTYTPQVLKGTKSEVRDQKVVETKEWLIKACAALEYWHYDLSVAYRDSLDLIEATDLKIVAQSFGLGLSKYLFGEGAYLKEIDPSAWRGIQSRWSNSQKVVDSFFKMINKYCNWLKELKDRNSRITDPLGLRDMVHQKDDDTESIIAEYAGLASIIKPLIEEVLQFL